MRLLIATDAWRPQVNGVVTTLSHLSEELSRLGVGVTLLTPEEFPTMALPGHRSIRLAQARGSRTARMDPCLGAAFPRPECRGYGCLRIASSAAQAPR